MSSKDERGELFVGRERPRRRLLTVLGGVGLTQWVGRVIAGETFIAMAVLGVGIVVAMVRYLTATDPIGRQQLKWLAGGAFVSGTLALTVWFLPQLVFGEGLSGWASPVCRCWRG
jgi:hypothetical protein